MRHTDSAPVLSHQVRHHDNTTPLSLKPRSPS
ncbi:hypothetical protein ABH931_004209 [Streptacidiphilus sp. MAP12-33]